ncbi:MAG: hypothetical protein QM611_02010 [Microbacterium sp.]|uniref:hypothetical protein n=1 Tax=Microbacterium sp. TaxID=51671 RepID=UPI0039E62C8F
MTKDDHDRLIGVDELAKYDGDELYLFVGISTAGSSVHDAFTLWAPMVSPGAALRGVDIAEDAEPEVFRRLVRSMRDNPRVAGAVVTSHKLRLYRAVADLLDSADPFVSITHEINSLDTRRGRIAAYARDAQSLDIVLDTTGAGEPRPRRPFTCLGAGGSAIALMLAMGLDVTESLDTGRAVSRRGPAARGALAIVGRRPEALQEISAVRERAGLTSMALELVLAGDPQEFTAAANATPVGGVIANATGLGKLDPGSPVITADGFAPDTLAWDFNYRGPLTFLQQARAAGVPAVDGWDYFVAGWAAALSAITDRALTAEAYDQFRDASQPLRP